MKTPSCFLLAIAGAIFTGTPERAFAGAVTESAAYNPNLLIPDGSIVGVADTRIFTSQISEITNVRVSLSVTGTPSAGDAFNGDFYAYLTHGSGFSVLLNRVGRTASDPFGYGDSGFAVTFDDTLPGADIHNYQLTANPAGGILTGIWHTDGRNINPQFALDTTPRNAFLTTFSGLEANGAWTLFVADTAPLGTARFASWKLEITGNVIPEPTSGLVGLSIFAMLLARRRPGK